MNDFDLKGLGVALVTPFKHDKTIDFDALENLIEHLIDNKVDFLVVLGTTGETPTLSESEKIILRKFVRETVAGRVPLVLGHGGNNTAEIVEALKTDITEGYDAVLS